MLFIDTESIKIFFKYSYSLYSSIEAKKIIHLYTKGDIDLETAKFAIGRIVARW